MSRHNIKLEDGRLLAIGWDYIEGGSYYAQVMDKTKITKKNHLGIVVEIGGYVFFDPPFRFETITNTAELAAKLSVHSIELTSEQASWLEADKLARGSGLSPLQKRMQEDRELDNPFAVFKVATRDDGRRD